MKVRHGDLHLFIYVNTCVVIVAPHRADNRHSLHYNYKRALSSSPHSLLKVPIYYVFYMADRTWEAWSWLGELR